MKAAVCLLLILPLTVASVIAQEPPGTSGTVEGIVFKWGSRDGLEGVAVTLQGSNRSPTTTITDGEGRFLFTLVPPGTFTVSAQRTGFVEPRIGSTVLSILPDQRLTGIELELAPASAIAGRVLSASGEPRRDVVVTAVQEQFESGRRELSPCFAAAGARSETDENGAYRLYNLEPGEYYVSVGMSVADDGVCVTQYYPDAFDAADAIPLNLGVGQEQGGIDIRLRDIERYQVRFTGEPRPVRIERPGRIVQIVRKTRNGFDVTEVFHRKEPSADHRSTYVSPRLPPGSYEMFYSHDGLGDEIAHLTFSIVDRDVDLGTVIIRQGVSVYGQVSGDVPGILSGALRMNLQPLDARRIEPFFLPAFTRIDPTGTFDIAWPANLYADGPRRGAVAYGRYQVGILGLPAEAYIASATYGGRDVLDIGLSIDGDAPGPLRVTVAKGSAVQGVVRDNNDELVAGSRVILVPEARHRGNLNRYKAVHSDQDGRFRMDGVAPGDYVLFASDDLPDGAWQNAEMLAQLEPRGTRLRVEAATPLVTADVEILASRNSRK